MECLTFFLIGNVSSSTCIPLIDSPGHGTVLCVSNAYFLQPCSNHIHNIFIIFAIATFYYSVLYARLKCSALHGGITAPIHPPLPVTGCDSIPHAATMSAQKYIAVSCKHALTTAAAFQVSKGFSRIAIGRRSPERYSNANIQQFTLQNHFHIQ